MDHPVNYWLAPFAQQQPNAREFASKLCAECVWSLDDFGGGYPWEADVPPQETWDDEIAKLNEHLTAA